MVFDLDGTLVDTIHDLLATLNHVLADIGCAPVPTGAAQAMVGGGARLMLERGLAASDKPASPAELDQLFEQFLVHYHTNIAVHSRPFPGVLEAMARFRARGWRFAVCTNKLERLSRKLLDELDLTQHFEAICGSDTFANKKPHPEHLLKTIAQAGGDPRRAVMIGDSRTDIDTAKAAGVPVVAVDFGYTDVPVTQLGPDRVISHYDALDAAVAELLPS
jgi:phosphoglycolate phosphatase